jgi:hypothetical protein
LEYVESEDPFFRMLGLWVARQDAARESDGRRTQPTAKIHDRTFFSKGAGGVFAVELHFIGRYHP